MMVGNGATNWSVDVEPSFPATVRYFNIIPPKLYDDFELAYADFKELIGWKPPPGWPFVEVETA